MTSAPAAPIDSASPCREGRARHDGAERNARWVLAISIVTMVAEIATGRITGSLALYADGWHMATHAGALASTVLALWFARRYRQARHFSFGTGKVHALAGWTSALILVAVGVFMLVEAGFRIEALVRGDAPSVEFMGALIVAVIGLVVNLGSVALLGHDHGEARNDAHDGHDEHEDHAGHGHGHGAADPTSLRSSGIDSMLVHLLADALTSALAIGALLGGYLAGWSFLDPLVAVVGGLVVIRWAFGLIKRTGKELLDATPSTADEEKLRAALERDGDVRVLDLHLWDQGPGHRFAIVSLEVKSERGLSEFRAVAHEAVAIDHLTIEIGRAPTLSAAGHFE